VIATKVGFMAVLAPETIAPACDASLERLGIEQIDLYYQHKDDESVPLADSLGEFDKLAKAGKIRAIGLSQFTAPRLQQAMGTAAAGGMLKPCCLQTWYNLVEREKFEGELRDTALANGLGVFPFYSLANGFLSGKYRTQADLDKSTRGSRSAGFLEGRGLRVLAELDAIAGDTGAALATISLAWIMAQPGIVAALASATSIAQLHELTAAFTLTLTPDQIARLDAASAEVEPEGA
jgi:aryl-alcohol dehydrogenase-like predicted oxidoreductase